MVSTLAPLLERMAQRQPPFDLTQEPRAFLEGIGELRNPCVAEADAPPPP